MNTITISYNEEEIRNDSVISGYEEKGEDVIQEEKEEIKIDIPWKNRELSWLDYNRRVLDRTLDTNISYEETLNYLGYASANLDEFISVRFAEFYHRVIDKDTSTNIELYKEILNEIKLQKYDIGSLFITSFYKKYESYFDISSIEENIIKDYFMTNIFPALTPIALTNNKEVPLLNDNDINLLIKLKDIESNKKSTYCLLQIPSSLGRVIKITDKCCLIDELIEKYLTVIFSNKIVHSYILFRVNKDYSIEVSNNIKDKILTRVDDMLRKKRDNNIIYLDVLKNKYSEKLIKDLIKLTKVPKEHISYYDLREEIGLEYLRNKPYKKILGKSNDKIKPIVPSDLFGYDSILEYLDDNEELLLHHPYETYDLVVNLIKEAAIDPNVLSIKQTLYRVSGEKSPIVKALCLAAKNGVRVTVMLELLARFDEKQNLRIVEKLKSAGCTVIYSLDRIKTHCKICLITKSTKKGIKTYSHIGTGNYNEKTSIAYADISYFTTNSKIASELTSIFNMITGFSKPTALKLVHFSPISLRDYLTDKIINWKNYGIEKIKIKVNSISDPKIVETIYNAADEGLKFDIICRGVCSLIPKTNIEVHSIVGRFLEHSRMYLFETNDNIEVNISSSDLLTRNLDKRIEVLVPVESKKYKNKVLNIFNTLWEDTYNTFIYTKEGKWEKRHYGDDYVNCYDSFIIE